MYKNLTNFENTIWSCDEIIKLTEQNRQVQVLSSAYYNYLILKKVRRK